VAVAISRDSSRVFLSSSRLYSPLRFASLAHLEQVHNAAPADPALEVVEHESYEK